ncbi:MAG: hypothetical protein PHP27_01795, partial [Bacteroidales bacterium]|nr:hypothetical protein [Bacteroidales bacterium]
METINFRKTLIEIAQEESEDSKIAKIIAYYYNKLDLSDRNSFFDSLLNLYSISENQIFNFDDLNAKINNDNNLANPKDFTNKDFRIKNIEISNLRGIPSVKESRGIPYGINLVEEDICHNAIILANNGSGKSSIFAGLEMVYAHEIGEKRLRTKTDNPKVNEYQEYLKRFPNNGVPICNIQTFDGNYSLENKIFEKQYLDIFNPISHFITEYDIIENGRIDFFNLNQKFDYSFHNILTKALGLNEYLAILTISEQIPSYSRRKEANQSKKLLDEIKINEDTLKNRKILITSKQDELNEINKGTIDKNNVPSSIKEKVIVLNKIIEDLSNTNFDLESLSKGIEEFNNSFLAYLSIEDIADPITEKNFLEQGLSLIKDIDNCPFCLDSKINKDQIITETELRIKKLDLFEERERTLKLKYRNLTSIIYDTIQKIKKLCEILDQQQSILSQYPNLDSVRKREIVLILRLNPHINDDELFDFIKILSDTQFPTTKEFNKLHDFIIKNTDLINNFIPLNIKELKNIVKEKIELIEKEIINIQADSEEVDINERIKNLEKEINEHKISLPLIEKRIEDLYLLLKQSDKIVSDVNKIKDEIRLFNINLSKVKDGIVMDYFYTIKDVVENIMNDFIEEDEKIKIMLDIEEIKKEVDGDFFSTEIIVAKIIKENEEKTTPDIYFNTFRYKVFCLMINLSIALTTRMRYKINLPLVMDDLFFASDFISKNSFSSFLKKIIHLFYKYTPEMPFQFILFTHDDLIFRSALDAVDYFNYDSCDLIEENKIKLH